jgi:hypothetical protein
MSKQYNSMCGESEIDRYTYAMYSRSLNYITKEHEKEWHTAFEWYTQYNKLKLQTRKNKYIFLDHFYDIIYNISDNVSIDKSTRKLMRVTSKVKNRIDCSIQSDKKINATLDSNDSSEHITWLKKNNDASMQTKNTLISSAIFYAYSFSKFLENMTSTQE